MPQLHSPAGALWVLQALVSAFLAILFLQSGIDKVVDRKGNLAWLTGHFAKSPLASSVAPMLTVITILEVAAGILSGVGSALVVLTNNSTVAFYGALLAGVALTALFFGQRIAKDYPGAAALVPYFLLVLAGIHILSRA
ncbi:MAG: DoxX family protein [Gemmatimonadaceae bacterium]|nr:DoxX family protein [Gemmatimonadaceae bacterium]